jgi:DNA-directed RNA polymerase specialized sigma24 family protein
MNDLVQVDIDTALALYLKGYTHIPVLQRDGYSSDWSSMQPLFLDDVLNNLMAFASDAKRTELLNPPKVDISKIKEEIALERRNLLSDDEDDYEDGDPDWVETEPAQVESIPDDDEVPERERIPYEKPEVITVEQVIAKSNIVTDKSTKALAEEMIAKIQAGNSNPLPWNVRDAIRLHDKDGMSYGNLAKLYGIKSPQTVINRINQYKMK